MSIYVHLPILIVVVSLVYSATRYDAWDKIIKEAVHWGLRMTSFLVSIGLVLYVLTTFSRTVLIVAAVVIAVLFGLTYFFTSKKSDPATR